MVFWDARCDQSRVVDEASYKIDEENERIEIESSFTILAVHYGLCGGNGENTWNFLKVIRLIEMHWFVRDFK